MTHRARSLPPAGQQLSNAEAEGLYRSDYEHDACGVAFVADMQATGRHSPATVRKIGQILAKIMSGAVDAGLIARSPCVGVALPAEPRPAWRSSRVRQPSWTWSRAASSSAAA